MPEDAPRPAYAAIRTDLGAHDGASEKDAVDLQQAVCTSYSCMRFPLVGLAPACPAHYHVAESSRCTTRRRPSPNSIT
jgi:hypothetical protein